MEPVVFLCHPESLQPRLRRRILPTAGAPGAAALRSSVLQASIGWVSLLEGAQGFNQTLYCRAR